MNEGACESQPDDFLSTVEFELPQVLLREVIRPAGVRVPARVVPQAPAPEAVPFSSKRCALGAQPIPSNRSVPKVSLPAIASLSHFSISV